MGKLKNIFVMNERKDGVEAGTYEEALNVALKALNNMD